MYIHELIPIRLYETLIEIKNFYLWARRGFSDNAPQLVKEKVFKKYSIPLAPWIETGSFIGTSANYFSKNYSFVYSIEPSVTFYNFSKKRFRNSNVELFNDTSENLFPDLLKKISGDVNFWLDGHYSGGQTFGKKNSCPVPIELKLIEDNMENFAKVSIFIDDMRCFRFNHGEYADYPPTEELVNWALKNCFRWHIENDIFVMIKQNK